jgi:DNA modification methylase
VRKIFWLDIETTGTDSEKCAIIQLAGLIEIDKKIIDTFSFEEVHDLMQQIHGKKVSTLPDATGWSMADTAELMNRSKQSVSNDINIASAVEQFPELFAACKTKSDAAKLLNQMEETLIREELSKRITTGKGSDILRRLSNAYITGDFFEKAKSMQSNLFNLIEIDPPYAINLTDIKKQEEITNGAYNLSDYREVESADYESFMRRMLKEAYRLGSEHSWLIVWFGPDPWFERMYTWITEAGYSSTRLCGIWTKGHGQSLNPNTRLANSYEMFFYAWKGSPALAKPGSVNEFRFPPDAPQKKGHPTQRPINLMSEIYSTFAFEGSRILIPCGGSGTGIIAANECKMNAVATEINPAYRDSFILMLNEYLQGR